MTSRCRIHFDPLSGLSRDRAEFSGGIAMALAPRVSLFGSASHTIATTAENGAGATILAGMSFYIAPPRTARPRQSRSTRGYAVRWR